MFVKIIASLGPSTSSIEIIEAMARAGVNGFRINFAHGDPQQWARLADMVRTVEKKIGRPLALIGDLQGPSIRLGYLEKPVVVKRGNEVRFVLAERSSGEDRKIPLPVKKFFESVDVGDILIMDDGRVRLRVVDKPSDSEIVATALTDATITSRKAVVVFGKDIDLPAISMRDLDCIKFAVAHGFDYIALSYVRRAEDILILREILRREGGEGMGIIAKIETRSAIENLDSIIDASDVILVARGDLGMNFGLEEVHHYQKIIVNKCIEKGKPVIVATQLLESMVEKPVPTRAEIVDISTAVEMGVDALMLTGETSVGKHPVEAVRWLRRVIDYTEKHYLDTSSLIREAVSRARSRPLDLPTRFAKGVVELAEDLEAKLMVYSVEGNTARRISSLRPLVPVYVGTPSEKVMRRLAILWGLNPIHVEARSYDEGLTKMLEIARQSELVSFGETVVLTYGLREARQRIEVLRVA